MAKATGRGKTAGRKAKENTGKPSPRGVGRPPRLSREAILQASVDLLEKEPVEDFTLARVARALDTVSMALYNYFPSREALLSAVADDLCMRFRMPRPRSGQTWQKKLRAWLDALRTFTDQHPVILKVMGVDGKTTAGWLRVTLTVSQTLYEEGMRGKDLALNSYLFCSQAIALVMFEKVGASFHSTLSLGALEELEQDEQEFLLQLRPFHIQLSTDDVLEAGFDQLLRGLEARLAALQPQPG